MLAGPLLTHTPRVPSLDEVTLARCWQRLGSAIDFLDPDLSLVVRLRHPAAMIGALDSHCAALVAASIAIERAIAVKGPAGTLVNASHGRHAADSLRQAYEKSLITPGSSGALTWDDG